MMHLPKHFARTAALLLLAVLVLLPQPFTRAQQDPLPMPPPPTGEEITPAPSLPQPQPETQPAPLLSDDFENGLSRWIVSGDVLLEADADGNTAARFAPVGALAPVDVATVSDFNAVIWLNLVDETSTLALNFGAGESLTLSSAALTLAVNGQALAQVELPLPTQTWLLLAATVNTGTLTVTLNDAPVLTAPLTSSSGAWTISGANVSIDDVLFDVPAAPAEQPPATLEPPIEVTVIPEPTAEITPNPEITQEPLPEVTAEVTVEATPEPTATPDADDSPQDAPYDAAKVSGVLAALLDVYQSGGQAAANALAADHFVTFNANNRTMITVYGVPATSAENLRAEIKAQGGWSGSDADYGVGVEAYLSLEEAAALSLLPEVAGLNITPRLGSVETEPVVAQTMTRAARAPIGNAEPQGYALTGAESWHRAGYQGGVDGNRVRVAVIDVGFGTVTTVDSDLACYRGSSIAFAYPASGVPAAGDSFRGRYMAEVICDIAPGSNVRLYKATTAGQLAGAINAAVSGSNDVIVIGVDLGVHVAAGDGGQSGAASVYTALENARASGVVVIAAAGNNGQALKTFTMGATANLTIKAGRGDLINVGWNGWGDASNISGTLKEGGSTLATGNRTGGGAPGYQLVPKTCTTDANGLCTLTLELSGDSGKTVQVQAVTTKVKVNTDFSYVDTLEVTLNGGTALSNAGTIGRPADSPNVIAVGAVCADVREAPYQTLAYSATGPIFGTGGTVDPLPTAPLKRGQVKPDIVAPSHVAVNSGGGMAVSSSDLCTTGFGGTQAAAAHVAGMTALLLQNTSNSTFQTLTAHDRVKDYFQQRAADFPLDAPDGFDMAFGAGLATLGQPSFDYDAFFSSPVPATIPNRLPSSANCSGGYIYVGQHNYGSAAMNGSIANPYHSIMQAVQVATATPNTCVIVTGGEYATPLIFNGTLTNPVQVYGYASVVRTAVQPTILNVLNAIKTQQQGNDPERYAGVLFDGTSGHTLAGFNFREMTAPAGDDRLGAAGAAVVYASPNVKLRNNTFNGFTNRALGTNTALVEIVSGSHGAMLSNSTFSGNANRAVYPATTPPTYQSALMLVNVVASGTDANPVKVENNTFTNNIGVLGSYSIRDTVLNDSGEIGLSNAIQFYPLVRGLNSYVDFVNNQFTNNQFETLLTVATNLITPGSTADSVYRIFGNAFVSNTAQSAEGLTGPIINLFNAPKTYVVNNTFANNLLKSSENAGAPASIIGRGSGIDLGFTPITPLSFTGSMDNAPFDVHNNLFYRNILSNSGAIVRDMGGVFGNDCRSNTSAAIDSGATHNFAYRNGPSAGETNNTGDCNDAFSTPANNNRTNIDPLPLDTDGVPVPNTARYILSDTLTGTTPDTPGYYMMIPAIGTGADPSVDGVDAGNEAIITAVFPQFLTLDDPRGITRRNDGDGTGGAQIDIGAFEYTPLTLTQTDFTYSFNEDSGPFEFNIAEFIEGGFPPYRIDVTQYPQYFGTALGTGCGANFTPTARGVITTALDADTVLLAYCPPQDFHTSSALVDPEGTRVVFTLRDSTNASVSASVQYTVNPVNDVPLVDTIGDNSPVGDLQFVAVALNDTTIVRARPWVDFERNFVFSERNNTLEPALQDQVDYDYTYNNIERIVGTCPDGTTSNQSMPLPTVVNGRFVFTLPSSITESITTCFSYDARDRNNSGAVGNIIIVKALEEPADFTLVSPANDSTIETLTDLTTFTWNRPSNFATFVENGETYTLTLTYKGLIDEVALEKTGLTPDGTDDDGLSCTDTLCTYTLAAADRDSLISGQYEWNVTAFNDRLGKDATAAFRFQLSAGEQLIRNGNFEEAAPTRQDRARYWSVVPNKGTNSRRYCPVATGDCAFAIIGKPNINITLRQATWAFPDARYGDARDVLTFTGKVSANKARGGQIQVVVTYMNNQKAFMNYRVASGTYDFRTFQRQITLTGSVKQVQVFVRSNSAPSGRINVDDFSLVLVREKQFQLLTPVNGSSVTTVGLPTVSPDARTTKMLNRLTWNESEDVANYALTLKRILPTEEFVYNEDVFTAAADADPLTCLNNLCVFTLPAGLLDMDQPERHVYEWNVTAGNGIEAENGPYTFTVQGDVTELLYNGFMDSDNNKDKRPDSWATPGRVSDRLVCNAAAKHSWPAYQGYCSYVFYGKNVRGFNSQLVQTITTARVNAGGVTTDSTLTLRVVASGGQVADKAARVVAQVTLSNNRVYNIPLIMPKGFFGYTEFVGTLDLAEATLGLPNTVTVKNIKVFARYTGTRGTFKVDNISLAVEPPTP